MASSPAMTVMIAAVRKAARGVQRDFGELANLQVSLKGPGDYVTAADKRCDKVLREELQKARPDYNFLTEETGVIKGSDADHRFIIDPIDGTTNFMHAVPVFAINVALERKGVLMRAKNCRPGSRENSGFSIADCQGHSGAGGPVRLRSSDATARLVREGCAAALIGAWRCGEL